MTATAITTLPRIDNCFGNCPTCHKTDGGVSVGPDHWYVCHRHRTKWRIGSNLFTLDRSEQDALATAMLAGYCEVRPWLPDDARERLEREFRANPASECPF